jgi:phosphoglucomutase
MSGEAQAAAEYRNLAREYLSREEHPVFRKELEELLASGDEKDLADRFYTRLAFGTGGMRGVIGAGYNRMNPFTVSQATQGLANYIRKAVGLEAKPVVVIAYDSRRYSRLFAEEAAKVLCGNGIIVRLFPSLRPTPELSYAVRYFESTSGIVVTASHNPPEYNGYKVYWSDGGQIIAPHDSGIIEEVRNVTGSISRIPLESAMARGLFFEIGDAVDEAYLSMVAGCSLRPKLMEEKGKDLKVVYTPLHGSGLVPVEKSLSSMGIDVITVPEQREPDGNFPTVEYPNPEEASALKLAIELAQKEHADLVMATDPDSDRLGLAVPEDAECSSYRLLTGNQTGCLLADYIFSTRSELGRLPSDGAFVKTIVTTDLQRRIAESYGITTYDVLTGFKYIAAKIAAFEEGGRERFLFGGEESYGYLVTDKVRDKDAVSAAFMVAEMTLYHRSRGTSLLKRLEEIWERYGYFQELLVSRRFSGAEGVRKMADLMDSLRSRPMQQIAGLQVVEVADFLKGTRCDVEGHGLGKLELPSSNVLQFFLEGGSKVTVRPSGTEPKIKFYASVACEPELGLDEAKKLAGKRLAAVEETIDTLIGS